MFSIFRILNQAPEICLGDELQLNRLWLNRENWSETLNVWSVNSLCSVKSGKQSVPAKQSGIIYWNLFAMATQESHINSGINSDEFERQDRQRYLLPAVFIRHGQSQKLDNFRLPAPLPPPA